MNAFHCITTVPNELIRLLYIISFMCHTSIRNRKSFFLVQKRRPVDRFLVCLRRSSLKDLIKKMTVPDVHPVIKHTPVSVMFALNMKPIRLTRLENDTGLGSSLQQRLTPPQSALAWLGFGVRR
jgi:hypothetical protein